MATLQQIALNEICRDLEKLKDLSPNGIILLQKRYFDTIARAIHFEVVIRQEMSPDWIDFMINPYATETELNIMCKFYDCDRVLERLKVCGESFHGEIKFVGRRYWPPSSIIKCLMFTPNIRGLDLNCGQVSIKLMKSIVEHCPNLQVLNLSKASVSDKALEHFRPVQQVPGVNTVLRVLDLDGCRVTKRFLKFLLNHFPNLQTLNHEMLPIVLSNLWLKNPFDGISGYKSYNIKTIKLTGLFIYGFFPLFIVCPLIESLTFDESCSDTVCRAVLTRLRPLKCLKINWCQDIGRNFYNGEPLSWNASKFFSESCHILVELYLRQISMDSSSLKGLLSCRHLKRLTIICVHFEELKEADKSTDSCFPSLEYLDVRDMYFDVNSNRQAFRYLVCNLRFLHTFVIQLNYQHEFPTESLEVLRQNRTFSELKRIALSMVATRPLLREVTDIIDTATQLEVLRFVNGEFHVSTRKALVNYCKKKWLLPHVGFVKGYHFDNDPFSTDRLAPMKF